MIDLIIFLSGMYCGHVVSPWIDGKLADWNKETDK